MKPAIRTLNPSPSKKAPEPMRRVSRSHPLPDLLQIQGEDIAAIFEDARTVRPMHGYYPPHRWAKRVKQWAKRHGYSAPLH